MAPNRLVHSTLAYLAAISVASVIAAEPPTFSGDIAPLFYQHCVQCHRPGEVAPMSLLTYESARPWAKSIAKAVESLDMPPFSPESDSRHWQNDISLAAAERESIVAWVKAGAPEGDPAALPEAPTFPEGWTLGEPDYVVTLSTVSVPAAGDDMFPKELIELDLDRARWVRAIEFLPGDRRVAHHMQTTYSSPEISGDLIIQEGEIGAGRGGSGVLAIWTAGMPPYVFPQGMGRVLTPGTKILVDSHYHPFGEAATDQTRIGLYFGEGELEKEVATMFAVNTGIRIEPGSDHHAELAFEVFDQDMQILAFSPHMHVRGKAMRYDLTYPDGRQETLLDVPRYDYNWQWLYYPTEPIDIPAGSRLDVTAVWDNSEGNPANPDPEDEIIYRGNTFNEMFVGFFEVIQKDGVYHQPKPQLEKLADLLAQHPGEQSFLVKGFLPFGFWAPREGEGWLYLVQGLATFTSSLDDIRWDGDKVEIVTQFPTPEASATTTIIQGELDAEGRLRGTIEVGADKEGAMKVPFLAPPQSAGSGRAGSTASGGG